MSVMVIPRCTCYDWSENYLKLAGLIIEGKKTVSDNLKMAEYCPWCGQKLHILINEIAEEISE
jgi:hypothetical protein